jgi:MFS family permease
MVSARTLTYFMCSYLGLTVLGFHGTAALLPQFIDIWHLSATQAGWLLGIMSLCALAATPAIALTDRVDARSIMMLGTLVNASGYAGFGLFAEGQYSAMFFRGLMGIGFALSYMPGLKAMADRMGAEQQSRSASIYVSSFSICSSLSIAIAGLVAGSFGWRWAYAVPACSNLLAFVLLALFLAPAKIKPKPSDRSAEAKPSTAALLDFRPVIANRAALGFVIGNFAHSVELLAARGWTVAFLAFVAGLHVGEAPQWNLSLVATALILLGVPSAMFGGVIAQRYGLARIAFTILLCSAAICSVVGFAASWPYWLFFLGPLVLHNVLIMADGGVLSAGMMSRADPQRRGSTVAFYTLCGSVGSFLGPVLFGVMLDLAGGRQSVSAWGLAFASIGLISLISAFLLRRLTDRGTCG